MKLLLRIQLALLNIAKSKHSIWLEKKENLSLFILKKINEPDLATLFWKMVLHEMVPRLRVSRMKSVHLAELLFYFVRQEDNQQLSQAGRVVLNDLVEGLGGCFQDENLSKEYWGMVDQEFGKERTLEGSTMEVTTLKGKKREDVFYQTLSVKPKAYLIKEKERESLLTDKEIARKKLKTTRALKKYQENERPLFELLSKQRFHEHQYSDVDNYAVNVDLLMTPREIVQELKRYSPKEISTQNDCETGEFSVHDATSDHGDEEFIVHEIANDNQQLVHTNKDLNDELKARLIYSFIQANIKRTTENVENDPKSVLRLLKSNSKGFSTLFKSMCNYFDIECKIVQGMFRDPETNEIHDHFWNIAVISGNSKLIDCWWKDQERSFFMDPEEFIHSHYPKNVSDSLMTDIMNFEIFKTSPSISCNGLDQRFSFNDQVTKQCIVTSESMVTIGFFCKISNVKIQLLDDCGKLIKHSSCIQPLNDTEYEVMIRIPEAGSYDLKILIPRPLSFLPKRTIPKEPEPEPEPEPEKKKGKKKPAPKVKKETKEEPPKPSESEIFNQQWCVASFLTLKSTQNDKSSEKRGFPMEILQNGLSILSHDNTYVNLDNNALQLLFKSQEKLELVDIQFIETESITKSSKKSKGKSVDISQCFCCQFDRETHVYSVDIAFPSVGEYKVLIENCIEYEVVVPNITVPSTFPTFTEEFTARNGVLKFPMQMKQKSNHTLQLQINDKDLSELFINIGKKKFVLERKEGNYHGEIVTEKKGNLELKSINGDKEITLIQWSVS